MYSYDSLLLNNIAAMPIYGKNTIFFRTKKALRLNLGV